MSEAEYNFNIRLYNDKLKEYDRIIKTHQDKINMLNRLKDEVYEKIFKEDARYACSKTGYSTGDIVMYTPKGIDTGGNGQQDSYRIVIDRLQYNRGQRPYLHLVGRKLTKTGEPSKSGKIRADIYLEPQPGEAVISRIDGAVTKDEM